MKLSAIEAAMKFVNYTFPNCDIALLAGESYKRHFKSDREKGRPVLATMIVEGKVLKDKGQVQELKDIADNFIKQGPEPLTIEYINSSRYFMFNLLDDFVDERNHAEAIVSNRIEFSSCTGVWLKS